MKRMLLLSLSLCCSTTTFAQQFFCGYKDYLHLSNTTPSNLSITEATSGPEIRVQILSPRELELEDTRRCITGRAEIVVAANDQQYCRLNIKDGPYLSNPIVTATCENMTYQGISYDGMNTFSYSLNFNL